MKERYTVLVEYLNPLNACEASEGEELMIVEATDEEDAEIHAAQRIYAQGFDTNDFRIISAVSGEFDDVDSFWEERGDEDLHLAELQWQYEDEQRQLEEDQRWEDYVNENYDFERGDWKY